MNLFAFKPSWSTYYNVNPISQHESVMNINSFCHSHIDMNNPIELDKENENSKIMSKSINSSYLTTTNTTIPTNTIQSTTVITSPPPLYNKIINNNNNELANNNADGPISPKFNPNLSYSIQILNNNNNIFNNELKNLYAEIEMSKYFFFYIKS